MNQFKKEGWKEVKENMLVWFFQFRGDIFHSEIFGDPDGMLFERNIELKNGKDARYQRCKGWS